MFSKIKISGLLVCVAISQLCAQDFAYKQHEWEKTPTLHTLSNTEKEGSYTVLKDETILEFAYDASGELVMYETAHMIIHFNNNEGIEERNKIYIPLSSVLEEINLKARTITSTGKVMNLNESSVKKVDNLENAGPYLIFAMEGVDAGGEIEYLYTNKKDANTSNSNIAQMSKLIKGFKIDIISPQNLIFEGKGYNGFPDFKTDTTLKEKNHIYSSIDVIPALNSEKYSAYDASKMRFEYQLAYNRATGKSRIYTWEYIGLTLHGVLFTTNKKEQKAVDKFLAKHEIAKLPTDEAKIKKIEQIIKTTIGLNANSPLFSIDQLFNYKYGNENALVKLYIAAAKTLNIPVELVITSDRMSRKFDPEFSSWNNLDNYLLYYPSFKQYATPANYLSRTGFPAPELTGNQGLYVKETTVGDMTTAVSKVKYISAPTFDKSHSNMNVSVTFQGASFLPLVKMKQDFIGYSAFYTQGSIPYLNDEEKAAFIKGNAQIMGEATVVKSTTITGDKPEDILVKPLIIESEVETPQLIENAGAKFIFKVGDLIGPQVEMYQEKERQTDAEIYYTHSYTRTIVINIPTGYQITNLDNININKKFDANGKTISSFVSKYTLKGNVLTIVAYEDYQELVYSKSKFEDYRQVINAAADFNKIALIFEKK
jgi:hypothetical protein